MATKGTILVGTIGQGVMMSSGDGESWSRASVRVGMHSDAIVKTLSLTLDDQRPSTPEPTSVSTRPTTAAERGDCATRR